MVSVHHCHTRAELYRGSRDGQAGQRVHGVHLRAPYRLRSADDLELPFSNFVRGYTGLLDYIWYDEDQLEVQVSPCPYPASTFGQSRVPLHFSYFNGATWRCVFFAHRASVGVSLTVTC